MKYEDYPLYAQRPKHQDDTVLGTLGLLLFATLFCVILFHATH